MLQEFYASSLQILTTAGKYITNTSKEIAGPAVTALATAAAEKIKDLYHNNKEIVISISVATTVYLLMKPKLPKKQETKTVSKSKQQAKKSLIKSFISQRSEVEEEDPTMVSKREWQFEERQIKTDNFFSSDGEEQDNSDKIFFEMYKGYLQAS